MPFIYVPPRQPRRGRALPGVSLRTRPMDAPFSLMVLPEEDPDKFVSAVDSAAARDALRVVKKTPAVAAAEAARHAARQDAALSTLERAVASGRGSGGKPGEPDGRRLSAMFGLSSKFVSGLHWLPPEAPALPLHAPARGSSS
jgi:hypothetical protein